MSKPLVALASFALLLAACAESPTAASKKPTTPTFEIVDGAHNGGNSHFYFLPPLVSQPAFSGTADATFTPIITVCEWNLGTCGVIVAQFTSAPGDYQIDWHTDQCTTGPCTMDPSKVYRLRVTIGSLELGHADLKFFVNAGQAKNVDTNDYIALVDGRTLPIRFRIETGAVPWTTKLSMQTARNNVSAGVVNGILYAVGGDDAGVLGELYSSVEAYNPATNSWTTKASMTQAGAVSVGVVNGILYAVGPNSLEAYNPITDTWTTKAAMPTPRIEFAVGVVNGILYAVGGNANGYVSPLGTVEAYDPATNTWATKAAMPTPRSTLGVGVINGILYAVGGFSGSTLGTVEAYDPATNTWATKAPMPTPRLGLAVGVSGNNLYAVGGIQNINNQDLSTMEAYHPTTDSWTTEASMPTPRFTLAAGVVNGVLYAIGGQRLDISCRCDVALGTVEAFSP